MNNRITVTEQLVVPYSSDEALAVIWNIKNIEVTECKADAVEVDEETDERGTYRVRGRFARIPWRGRFAYQLHETGFHSVDARSGYAEPPISGGFFVQSLGARHCLVVHYEQYVLPRWLIPFKPAIAAYLRSSMRVELRKCEQLIQEAHALRRAPSIASAR